MSDPENQTQALIGAPSQQTVINAGAPEQRGRSTRAYKVAGLTLLACVLILSQVVIAYFLLNQRNDIKSLEDHNNKLDAQLSKGLSGSASMRVSKLINTLHTLDELEDSSKATHKPVPQESTSCQKEAAGLKSGQVPGFRPACDEQGFYQALQCFMTQCWCVNTVSGQQIPGTLSDGPIKCSTAVPTGGVNTLPIVPHVDALMECNGSSSPSYFFSSS